MSGEGRLDGPIVLGVGWNFSEHLIRTAAELAAALGQHLICAFVDPASYLTEWIDAGHPYVAELARIRDVEYVDLPTGHWPQFTRPAELGQAILRAVDRTG